MAVGGNKLMTNTTTGSGYGAVSAARVAKPSPSFLLGRRRTDITVWIAGERLGNRVAIVAALGNKLLRSAKIPIDYQIQPRCGVGPVADC